MANAYDVGDLVRCTAVFADSGGVAHDPDTVYFQYKTPAGVVTTYQYGNDVAVERSTTGTYHVDLDITASGLWYYRFYATGEGRAAGEAWFQVRLSQFG